MRKISTLLVIIFSLSWFSFLGNTAFAADSESALGAYPTEGALDEYEDAGTILDEYEDGNTPDPDPTAQKGGTVLPVTSESTMKCLDIMTLMHSRSDTVRADFKKPGDNSRIVNLGSQQITVGELMGCGIKTGDIPLWMVPYFIRSMLEFVIGVAGLLSVGGIIFGGYMYLFAGLSDDKDRGKKAITYGIAGFIMTLISWAVVNIIIGLLTL